MKKNELTIVKGLDIKELKLKAKELKREIADLSIDKNMQKLKDLKQINKKKKDLAKILTVIRQKEILAELELNVAAKNVAAKKVEDKGGKK